MTIELNTLKDALKNITEEDNNFLLHHSDLREELIATVLPVAVQDYLTYLSENPDHNPADPYTALAGQDYLSLFSDDAMTATMSDHDAHEYHRFDTSQLATTPDRDLVRDDVEKACAAAIEIVVDEHLL